LIDERLELLVQEALKNYKSGSGIQPRATYEASYRTIGKHLISALYCAYHADERISLPLRPSAYGIGKVGRIHYSFRDTSKVREALVSLGWLAVEEEGTQGKYTLVAASGDLLRSFEEWGFRWMLPELLPEQACVSLKDVKRDTEGRPIRSGRKKQTSKVDLEVPAESPLVAQHRSNLTYINNKLRQHCISLDLSNEHLMQLQKEMSQAKPNDTQGAYSSIQLQNVQLTRIFSRGSMELGGRFYRGWWQSIPSKHRPHIRIDGKKTIEVDYSGMCLRILYAIAEQEMSLQDDPYDIGLESWDGRGDKRRSHIKKIINALINDEDDVFVIPKKALKLLNVTEEQFNSLLTRKHPLIAEQLNSGVGLKAQYIDSQIAEAVMLELMKEDIVVLPVHDSFIVPAGYQSALEASMNYHFNQITGSSSIVEAELVKTDEHFGMSSDEVLELQNQEGESVGIANGTETWEAVIGNQQRIMSKYLASWELWLASGSPKAISSLTETT